MHNIVYIYIYIAYTWQPSISKLVFFAGYLIFCDLDQSSDVHTFRRIFGGLFRWAGMPGQQWPPVEKKTRESKGGTAQLCVAGNLAGTHVKAGKNVLQLSSNV